MSGSRVCGFIGGSSPASRDPRPPISPLPERYQIAYVAELPLVADTIRRLRGLTRLVGLSVGWGVDDLTRSVADHDRLIDAIDSRDPDAAEQLLREHLLGLRGHTATTG